MRRGEEPLTTQPMDPTSQVFPVRTERLTKRFGRLTALADVSVEVGSGERLALFGRNGAGKTTFLRLLAGLARSDAGRITFGRFPLPQARAEVNRRMGFLSHNSLLYPDLSVWDNLIFASRLFGVRDPEKRIGQALSRVRMLEWRREKVRHLSSGMERRVAVARALLHQPTVLLLDEPFAGLDAASIAFVQEILEEHRGNGGSIILATHRREIGIRDATRAVIFDRGKVVFDGRPEEGTVPGLNEAYNRYVEGKT
jgi:heme exporter protein A